MRLGPSYEETVDNQKPKSGWIAMWEAAVWIVFLLLCFAYCCRNEIVEVMK